MASLGTWVEVSVSLSNRVRQYLLLPWAPQSGEHKTMQERSGATLVKTLRISMNLGLPEGHPEREPVKCLAAIVAFAAVEDQDVLLVTRDQLHFQIFP